MGTPCLVNNWVKDDFYGWNKIVEIILQYYTITFFSRVQCIIFIYLMRVYMNHEQILIMQSYWNQIFDPLPEIATKARYMYKG